MQLGNGNWESTQFNSRLHPTQIALGTTQNATNLLDLDYTYGTTQNNGNVLSQTITVPTVGATTGFTVVQNYSYDSLNRLKQADEKPQGWTDTNCTSDPTKCWKQTFVFDRYGNRRFDEASTTVPASFANQAVTNPDINPSNNRLSSTGWLYDSSGNTKNDPSGRSFVYDSENKQVSVSDGSGTIGQYFYDGDGKRVKKVVPSTGETTIFVYDAGGKLIGEYSNEVASLQDAKVAYLTNDHLGSPRINTDATGTITARHDYHPFGEEVATSQRVSGLAYGDDTVRKQFTGHERDDETELDFAKNRYLSSGTGRFSSPDNFLNGTRPTIPASWNLYVYVLNNPLRYTDPTGELEKDANGNVKFTKTGEGTRTVDKDPKKVQIGGKDLKINKKDVYVKLSYSVDTGFVKADDGTEIAASKATSGVKAELVDKDGNALNFGGDAAANQQLSETKSGIESLYDPSTNCHGSSFASGQVWINNEEVGKLITGDSYRPVTGDERVRGGDVIVYSSDGSLAADKVKHSATLNASPFSYTVNSKSGIEKRESRIDMGPGAGTAWRDENVKLTVWTQRPKS